MRLILTKIAKCMWICKVCIHTCLKLQDQVAAPPCSLHRKVTYYICSYLKHFYNDLKRECTNYFNCGQYVYMYRKSGLQRTLIYFLLAATFLSCRFIGSTSTCFGLWSLQYRVPDWGSCDVAILEQPKCAVHFFPRVFFFGICCVVCSFEAVPEKASFNEGRGPCIILSEIAGATAP